MFALSFSPLLLSTLTRAVHAEGEAAARPVAAEALGVAVGLLPFAALAAGASREIAGLVLGEAFLPAAPLFAVLVFGALGLVWLSVAAAVLTAAGRATWLVGLAVPLLGLALAGHLALIPRLGAPGAAWVTTTIALVGAVAALTATHRAWAIAPSRATVLRAAVYSVAAYLLASQWSTPGWLVAVKLAAGSLAVVLLSPEYARWLVPARRRRDVPASARRVPSPGNTS